MKFSTGLALLSPLLVLSASASPLDKRTASETVYLSNCHYGTTTTYYSSVDYYKAGHNSQDQSKPDDRCFINAGDNSGYVTWEGGRISCKYSSGTTFIATIQPNSQGQADFSQVGTATNGYHNFNCYKDNHRTVFPITSGTCQSIYYCLPA